MRYVSHRQQRRVIALYALGIAVIGAGGVLVPLLTSTPRTEETAAREAERERRVEAVQSELEAAERARDELDSIRTSQAQFELFEDKAGEFRWRLRHRNGNVIADGGEGYSSRTAAHEAIEGVKRNAPGAGVEAE